MLKANQLEELARLHEIEEFDESRDNSRDVTDDGADSVAAWRRGMIENALANVKRATEAETKIGAVYEKGALVYDATAKKFARVLNAAADALDLEFIAGGSVRYHSNGEHEVLEEAPKPEKATKTAAKASSKTAKATKTAKAATKTAKTKSAAKPKAASTKKTVEKTVASKAAPKKSVSKSPAKPAVKKQASTNIPASATVSFELPKGCTTDPIADPNGYIKQSYMFLNNKEIAEVTGLSEHTIRRKLGEWGLKRKRS